MDSSYVKLKYKRTLLIVIVLSICTTISFMVLSHFLHIFQLHVNVLLVDKSNKLLEDDQIKNAYKSLPSFPFDYWMKSTRQALELNGSCAKFPSALQNVEFQNTYWQNLRSTHGHYQLFGAYLDTRDANPLGPTVRVLAMVDLTEPIQLMFCTIWFQDQRKPAVVKAFKYDLPWYKEWGKSKYQPYLIPCQIPREYHNYTVSAVSLVENYCDTATNVLRVYYNKSSGKKRDFAICVKGMDFLLEDVSSIVTEWIEMMGILGAHKIFMYDMHVHPNISKVLKYYEELGRVEVVPLTLPAGQPNTPYWQHIYLDKKTLEKWQGEIIPYNDCFYKNMYNYHYIVLVDIDEIIVPRNGTTWKDLLDYFNQTLNKQHDSYNIRNVYFVTDLLFTHKWFDDIPDYMHVLNHVYRDRKVLDAGINIKSFHNTETVLSLHNHFPVACLRGGCINYAVDPKYALMHHYKRKSMDDYNRFRESSMVDTVIWEYKEPLIERVTKALQEMGFLISLTKTFH